MNNKKGFTLIELIVVIAVLALIMSIALPSLFNRSDNNEKQKEKVVNTIITSAESFVEDKRSVVFPASSETFYLQLQTIVDAGLLKTPINNPVTDTPFDLETSAIKIAKNSDNTLEYEFVEDCSTFTKMIGLNKYADTLTSGTNKILKDYIEFVNPTNEIITIKEKSTEIDNASTLASGEHVITYSISGTTFAVLTLTIK